LTPIDRVGLFVPSGKASYPSVLVQIGTPAVVAGVAEIAVVGVPSELTEDEVLAVVVPDPAHTIDPAEVRRHCVGRLPRHALPRFVSIQDSLPHNASFKVSRAELRRRGLPAGTWDAESGGSS
jgi:crotonobetaine/carnitine-CoA ligase